jgi:hypothetical protein
LKLKKNQKKIKKNSNAKNKEQIRYNK